jgi:hypothetical protein
MRDVAQHLRDTVRTAVPRLLRLSSAEVRANPYPPKWSKIEVLGHLIDSASNNHQKFVRTMEQSHLVFPGYSQNHWTDAQQYLRADWQLLVRLFESYNEHLAHVIEHAPEHLLLHTITIEGVRGPAGPFALEFIMRDYIEHMKHHLLQIDVEMPLRSGFENVYGA